MIALLDGAGGARLDFVVEPSMQHISALLTALIDVCCIYRRVVYDGSTTKSRRAPPAPSKSAIIYYLRGVTTVESRAPAASITSSTPVQLPTQWI